MSSNHLILCHPLLLLSIFLSIRVFSNGQFFSSSGQSIEVSASASVLSMNIQYWYPLRWTLDLLEVLGTLQNLLQHHSSKSSILWCSAFYIVQLLQPYITVGKTIALTAAAVAAAKSLNHVQLCVTPWTAAHQASASITNSRSLLKLVSIKSVMPSTHLILCRPLSLLPPIPPSIRSLQLLKFNTLTQTTP